MRVTQSSGKGPGRHVILTAELNVRDDKDQDFWSAELAEFLDLWVAELLESLIARAGNLDSRPLTGREAEYVVSAVLNATAFAQAGGYNLALVVILDQLHAASRLVVPDEYVRDRLRQLPEDYRQSCLSDAADTNDGATAPADHDY